MELAMDNLSLDEAFTDPVLKIVKSKSDAAVRLLDIIEVECAPTQKIATEPKRWDYDDEDVGECTMIFGRVVPKPGAPCETGFVSNPFLPRNFFNHDQTKDARFHMV